MVADGFGIENRRCHQQEERERNHDNKAIYITQKYKNSINSVFLTLRGANQSNDPQPNRMSRQMKISQAAYPCALKKRACYSRKKEKN